MTSRPPFTGAGMLKAGDSPVPQNVPSFLYLLPVVLLAWGLERLLLPFSNWVPLLVAVWLTTQYWQHRTARALQRLNHQWECHVLRNQASTAPETVEWLNKLLLAIWPNYLEPKAVRKLMLQVQKKLKEKKHPMVLSIEVLELSLGTAPPKLGPGHAAWWDDTAGDGGGRGGGSGRGDGVSSGRGGGCVDSETLGSIVGDKRGGPGPRASTTTASNMDSLSYAAVAGGANITAGASSGTGESTVIFARGVTIQSIGSEAATAGSGSSGSGSGSGGGDGRGEPRSGGDSSASSSGKTGGNNSKAGVGDSKAGGGDGDQGGGTSSSESSSCPALFTQVVWDSDELSIALAAKLGGAFKGTTAKVTVTHVRIKGELRIFPILSGQALLYGFTQQPEVQVEVGISGGNLQVTTSDLPGVATWLERLLAEALSKAVVSPRWRIKTLPVTKCGRRVVGGAIRVTVESGRHLEPLASSWYSGRDMWPRLTRSGVGSQRVPSPFVELSVGKLTRMTKVVAASKDPEWGNAIELVVHGSSTKLRVRVFDAGSSGSGNGSGGGGGGSGRGRGSSPSVGIQHNPLGSAIVNVKWVADNSTIFYAAGREGEVAAARVESIGSEAVLMLPLEESSRGEVTLRLSVIEWQYEDGTHTSLPAFDAPTALLGQAAPLLTGRTLVVRVVEGRHLVAKDITGSSDPYIKLTYGRVTRKTRTVRQSLDPQWEEEFEFKEFGGEHLRIKCYDADRFGDEDMGEALINLQALAEGQERDVWVPLERVNQGEVRLRLTVHGEDFEVRKEEAAVLAAQRAAAAKKGQEKLGPGTIEVTLVEAKDLIPADRRGTSDPYVSVRYGQVRKRSRVIHRTLAPQWNQTLEFEEAEGVTTMELHVKDYNTLFASSSIGVASLTLLGAEDGAVTDQWLPLRGVATGQVHVRLRRRPPPGVPPPAGSSTAAVDRTATGDRNSSLRRAPTSTLGTRLRTQESRVRDLLGKAASLVEEEAMEPLKRVLEELRQAEEERGAMVSEVQRNQDTLIEKVQQLDQAMAGLGA